MQPKTTLPTDAILIVSLKEKEKKSATFDAFHAVSQNCSCLNHISSYSRLKSLEQALMNLIICPNDSNKQNNQVDPQL